MGANLALNPRALAPNTSDVDLDVVANLVDDSTTTFDDKLARVLALQAWWKYEDTEEEALNGDALQALQRNKCKELELIVCRFPLYDPQVEAIYSLFYERGDLLLLAKTGFGKSLIFQLIPFLKGKFWSGVFAKFAVCGGPDAVLNPALFEGVGCMIFCSFNGSGLL